MTVAMTVLVALGFVTQVVFVVLFAGAGWRHSAVGRNLMIKSGVLGVMFGLLLVARLVEQLPALVWLATMAALDAVMVWRVLILWRLRKGERS